MLDFDKLASSANVKSACSAAELWERRHPLNVPGIFFTAETDTFDDFREAAPQFIGFDEHFHSFICRQPESIADIVIVSEAASMDPMQEFSASGLSMWTMSAVTQWWNNDKPELETWVEKEIGFCKESGRHFDAMNGLKDYFKYGLEEYIREFKEYLYRKQ